MKLQLAGWRGAVNSFSERDERHTNSLKVFEQRDEMPEVASEPVQPPADQHVESSPLTRSSYHARQQAENGSSV